MRIFLTITIMLFVSITTTYANSKISCQNSHCIAVVDAGSAGSRIHLFTFDTTNKIPTYIKEMYAKKISPGLATMDLNQNTINQYLNTLFAIETDTKVPVYFYATAGMRLLPQLKQQNYYNKIRNWFDAQDKWQLISAKTISGQEEGVFGWLAVNYALGYLNTKADSSYAGVMDTGGASVQITFSINNTQNLNKEDQADIEVYGKKIHLFAHSFLGLGQNELDHQFLDAKACFSNQYILTNNALAQGDLYQCEQQTAQLINAVHKVNTIVKPIVDANPVALWYGIGGISYLVQTPPLHFSDNQLTMQELAENANKTLCQQDWNTLYAQYTDNDFLYISCLNSAYFYALFVDGYGINPNQAIHYFPLSQSSNDWTLGVVLHQ